MDEGDAEIGYLLIIHSPYLDCIVFVYLPTTCILPHLFISWVKIAPLLQMPHSQIVLIVIEQLFEAGLSHIGQFYLCLTGGDGCLVALGNVLLPRTGSLHHLVDGAVSLAEITLGEVEGDVVNHLCHLIDPQISVMPMLGEKSNRRARRILRILSTRRIRIILRILSTRIFRIILIIIHLLMALI